MRNFEVAQGYPFTDSDVQSFNHVAVIGSDACRHALWARTPIRSAKSIRVKNVSFRVVGVLAEKGTGAFGIDQDNLVLVPITVAQQQMLGINYFTDMMVQANNNYTIDLREVTRRIDP